MSFFRFCWKNEKIDWLKCARTTLVRAHFGQSNFSFFRQKRKKEILLILIIFSYFKVQKKKKKKRKWWGKSIIFFHFSNFEVTFKNTKNTVNG